MSLLEMFDEMNDEKDIRTKDNYIRAPFKYVGSKQYIVPILQKYIPYRKTYIEVFGGSAALLLARDRSTLEVYNDRYAGVVAFYRCIRDVEKTKALIERLEWCQQSREEFIFCRETWKDVTDDVERAARWFYIQHFSFSGLGKYFGRGTTSHQAIPAIQSKLDMFMPLHERLKNVQIENLEWKECLLDYDFKDAVFYLDPPYLNTPMNSYHESMYTREHKVMLDLIHNQIKGFVALSGYANSLYDSYHWDQRIELGKSSGGSMKPLSNNETSNQYQNNFERSSGVEEILWIKE
jgi:DNA adenine methylase